MPKKKYLYGFGIRDSRSRINLFRIPDPGPGVKKAPDPGSGSATLEKAWTSKSTNIKSNQTNRKCKQENEPCTGANSWPAHSWSRGPRWCDSSAPAAASGPGGGLYPVASGTEAARNVAVLPPPAFSY
jgi:hypothetical protein